MFANTILDPAGPVALTTRGLLFEAVALMLIVIVPVFVLTGLIVWRYRAGNTEAKYAPDWDRSRVIEAGIWLVPLLIVGILWVVVWNRTHDLDPYRSIQAAEPPLEIQAVALDWQWLFIYPAENVASLNHLIFPAGRPLSIVLTSDTVMNSFFIPALGGQIYAMAGMRTRLNLMADAPGTFVGRNTQFSGDGFAGQSFDAVATDAAGFEAFVDKARASGESLDTATFEAVSEPTIAGPVKFYSAVETKLFDTILAGHGSMPHSMMAPWTVVSAPSPATAFRHGHGQ